MRRVGHVSHITGSFGGHSPSDVLCPREAFGLACHSTRTMDHIEVQVIKLAQSFESKDWVLMPKVNVENDAVTKGLSYRVYL